MLATTVVLAYPLSRFLFFYVPRQPRHIKVDKLLNDGDVFINPDFILFYMKKKVWAISRKCTHLGCRLNYSEKDHLLICPCHQSRFSAEGKRIAGPAKKNLARFPVEIIEKNGKSAYIVTL